MTRKEKQVLSTAERLRTAFKTSTANHGPKSVAWNRFVVELRGYGVCDKVMKKIEEMGAP